MIRRRGLPVRLLRDLPLQQLGGKQHRPEWRAQIVSQHCREQLIAMQHFRVAGELFAQYLPVPVELEEDLRLARQQLRRDRLVEEIHRAGLVAAETPALIRCAGRHEDDGDAARTFAAAHQLREFEAVDLGHLHVQDGERDLVLQHQLQGLARGTRLQHLHGVRLEQRRQCQQVLRQIVDDQTFDDALHDGFSGYAVWALEMADNAAAISSILATGWPGIKASAATAIADACDSAGSWMKVRPPAAWIFCSPMAPSLFEPLSSRPHAPKPKMSAALSKSRSIDGRE